MPTHPALSREPPYNEHKQRRMSLMKRYTINKAGKEYVVQADGEGVLICKSRREAERMVYDASGLLEASTRGDPESAD